MQLAERIDLIKAFSSNDWEHAVFLTYTHDLMFFEREILRKLREKGCKNVCLLVDETAHQETFENQKNIKLIGNEYIVQTIKAGLVFHPKLYILVNKERCKVIVGSGNLTVPGFYTNKELFSSLEFSLADIEGLSILRDIMDFLDRLAMNRGFRIETLNSLTLAFGNLPRKLEAGQGSDLDTGVFLHNLNQPLLHQIRHLVNDTIECLTVISPYFDTDHRILAQMKKEFAPQKLIVIIQQFYNNFNLLSFKKTAEKLGIHYELQQLTFEGAQHFRNHAKLIVLSSHSHDYLVWGSANFTTAALSYTSTHGNLETVLLQKTEKEWWKRQFFDDEVRVIPLDESKFDDCSTPDGYDNFGDLGVRLLDGTLTMVGLELCLAGNVLVDTLTLSINDDQDHVIPSFLEECKDSITKLLINIEDCPSLPPLPVFISVTIHSGGVALSSNKIWLNNSLELEKTRTDEAVLLKRGAFKNPDFTSQEQVLAVLDYIYRELRLEGKDLPKPVQRLVLQRQTDEPGEGEESECFPEENTDAYENWSVDPLDHVDYELYNRYVQAIYEEIGLKDPINSHSRTASAEKDVPHKIIVLSNEDRDRIKERFRGFIRRYMRGLTDEEYLTRVPVESVLWHYTVITSSFLKIIIDRPKSDILEFGFIQEEYKVLHSCLLKALSGRVDSEESRTKFREEVLPVILANLLVEYYQLLDSGEAMIAASCRERLEHAVQLVQKDIVAFKASLGSEFIKSIIIFSKLFGGLESRGIKEITSLIEDSFGSISSKYLPAKLSAISGVYGSQVIDGRIKSVVLESGKLGEPLNWIILSALYWLVITEEYEQEPFIMVTVLNSDPTAKRRKVVFLLDRINSHLYSRQVYANGNESYWLGKNVDSLQIRGNFRHNNTEVLKNTVQLTPSDDIKDMMRDEIKAKTKLSLIIVGSDGHDSCDV